MGATDYSTPVLLVLYRRVKQAGLLFETLEKLKPRTIYVYADAPCNEEEKNYCEEVRNIFEGIHWTQDVHRFYREEHSGGSTNMMPEAITWFFSQVEQGIVLEDDCIPGKAFFDFCAQHADEIDPAAGVFQLSGTNLAGETKDRTRKTSFLIPPWGWASTREAWKYFNPDFSVWRKHTETIRSRTQKADFWLRLFETNQASRVSWDLQWMLSVWIAGGYSLLPSHNLIKNVGFDKYATLTGNALNPAAHVAVSNHYNSGVDTTPVSASEQILEKKVIEFIERL